MTVLVLIRVVLSILVNVGNRLLNTAVLYLVLKWKAFEESDPSFKPIACAHKHTLQ